MCVGWGHTRGDVFFKKNAKVSDTIIKVRVCFSIKCSL